MSQENKPIARKIIKLLKSIEREGVLNGIGKPEKLRYSNRYSRRIDNKNRLVYDVESDKIIVFSCKGHYDE